MIKPKVGLICSNVKIWLCYPSISEVTFTYDYFHQVQIDIAIDRETVNRQNEVNSIKMLYSFETFF